MLADKAYDADRIRELIQDQGATPNIPPKSNRRWKPCFSKRLYRERNLIEGGLMMPAWSCLTASRVAAAKIPLHNPFDLRCHRSDSTAVESSGALRGAACPVSCA